MAESKTFQAWLKLEGARRLGQLSEVDEAVDKLMAEENLKIEYY